MTPWSDVLFGDGDLSRRGRRIRRVVLAVAWVAFVVWAWRVG